jgi:hypothetical protein
MSPDQVQRGEGARNVSGFDSLPKTKSCEVVNGDSQKNGS